VIKLIELSDIHLLNNRTPTPHILKSLSQLMPMTEETATVDGIIFAGDLFDHAGSMTDERAPMILHWFSQFFQFCGQHQIFVRVLEGTRLHDRRQGRMLVPLAATVPGLDFRYIDTVTAEIISPHNLSVVYVPDDWKTGPEDAWADVQIALQEKGLTTVDIAVMHGSFPHQLPPVVPAPHHDPIRWERVVKHFILIGHIHIQSQKGKILAAGSTDRLRHGEPRPKGLYRITLRENGENQVEFIENKNAWQYITVTVTDLSYDEGMTAIRKAIGLLREGAYIQLVGNTLDPIIQSIAKIRELYPNLQWELGRVATSEKKSLNAVQPELFIPTEISPTSIVTQVKAKLGQFTQDPTLTTRALALLEEFIRESN